MEQLTKRMKSSLIQSRLANVLLMLVFLGAVFFFALPKIQDYGAQKKELNDIYTHINQIQEKGLTYTEFKEGIPPELSSDAYSRTLLQSTDSQLYIGNFTNTSTNDYNTFLTNLEKVTFDVKSSEDFVKKERTMDFLLPFYNKNNTFSDQGLTDFHFINYVENLIYTFNLEASGAIGIGELKKIGDEIEPLKVDNIQEGIFAIPLKFEVTGQKTDIIDFIHFFENVGSIRIDEGDMTLYEDKFISKVLEGDKPGPGYNIYMNHLAEVTSITLTEYPDSSAQRNEKSLIAVMKSDQAREKFTIKIELDFYVAGVPGYKIEKYIYTFLEDFQKLSVQVSGDAKKYTAQAYKFSEGNQIQAVGSLQSLDTLLIQLSKDVIELRKRLGERENIQELYDIAIGYRENISRIEELYDEKIEILTKVSN